MGADLENISKTLSNFALGDQATQGIEPWFQTYAGRKPSNTGAAFYAPVQIDGFRWDRLYPYRLVVIDTANSNKIVGGGSDEDAVITVGNGTSGQIVIFEPVLKWAFALPISPEQLSIADQFAITTSATLKGIAEEHNGIPFKNITASGSFGVWASRSSVVKPPGSPSPLESVFGGAIGALGNVIDQAKSVINSATSGNKNPLPISPRPGEQEQESLQSTGYYIGLALQQFLEQYAIAKTDPKNASWRLVFDIPKQNQSFVVTPLAFNWKQDKSRPMEVLYNLQLKAWRRIDLKTLTAPTAGNPFAVSPGLLQQILNTITATRSLMSASVALIGSVRSDIANVFNVLKQTSLLVKDLSGAILSVADLPDHLLEDAKSTIAEALVIQGQANLDRSSLRSEGLSHASVANGQLGPQAKAAQSIDPAYNVFKNPNANFDLFNSVPLYSLNLSNAQQKVVDTELTKARALTVADIKSFRATIQELSLQLSNSFGSGDAFYNKVYGRAAPSKSFQAITLDQYDILNTFYDTLTAYDALTATTFLDDINNTSNMDYVAGLADLSGISFSVPSSKILVPVPFGLTIEAISQRYLGDPQRWLEIATLNNLREPYIDESGLQLPLLSNASGRQVTVSSDDYLYVGQRVVLKSGSQTPTARTILNIDRLSDTSFLLTLDGEANLDYYLKADKAYIQAYLPGTINSQQKIFVPSNLPTDQGSSVIAPASTLSDPLTGVSNVDLLLDERGDLAVNNFGDFRLASGMTNLVQALRIKFGNQKNQWLGHENFGLGIRPGTINSTVNVNDLYKSINGMITQDPRFTSVQKLQIILNGPTLNISLAVGISGQRGIFPVNFTLTP